MGQGETWHDAAYRAANRGFEDRHPSKQPVGRDRSDLAADAAIQVALERMSSYVIARQGLTDGQRTLILAVIADFEFEVLSIC